MTDRHFFALMKQLALLAELMVLVHRDPANPDVDSTLSAMEEKAEEEPELPVRR